VLSRLSSSPRGCVLRGGTEVNHEARVTNAIRWNVQYVLHRAVNRKKLLITVQAPVEHTVPRIPKNIFWRFTAWCCMYVLYSTVQCCSLRYEKFSLLLCTYSQSICTVPVDSVRIKGSATSLSNPVNHDVPRAALPCVSEGHLPDTRRELNN
jgi:hypothetical protein